jgi:mannose-6-phosphate isomerase-like protein (cupin superfamily)
VAEADASNGRGTGVRIIEDAALFTPPGEGPNHWVERFRVPDLSVGTYSIPAGGTDDQTPHHEDEIYVVVGGRAILRSDGATVAVQAGSVIYVPAGENHTFAQITEDLTLLVVFAPAYGSR